MSVFNAPTGPTLDRRTYIGGSVIGALAGMDPHKSALDVWGAMLGLVSDDVGEAAAVGNALERPMLERLYAPKFGIVDLEYPGTQRHPTIDFIGATPDALHTGRAHNVQSKIVGNRQAWRWGEPSEGADALPPEVYCQKQWEMMVFGTRVSDTPALFGTEFCVYREIPYDAELAETLVEIATTFWNVNIVGGEMPSVIGSRDARRVLEGKWKRSTRPMIEQPTSDMVAKAIQYDVVRSEVTRLTKMKEELGAELCKLIGESEGFQTTGLYATWKSKKGSPLWKSIAMELGPTPELIAKYTSDGGRALSVRVKDERE